LLCVDLFGIGSHLHSQFTSKRMVRISGNAFDLDRLVVFFILVCHIYAMKQPEYIEGPKALENFKRGMIALFKVPKSAVLKTKKQPKKAASSRKSKRADRD
jgi:hypothetical protein